MDVSAFRLSWDKSTSQCYVIDENRKQDKDVTQIYYWEVNWYIARPFPGFNSVLIVYFVTKDRCTVVHCYLDIR